MTEASNPGQLVGAVHAGIDRVKESGRAHRTPARFDHPLRCLGETADELAVVAAGPGASQARTVAVEALLRRLSGACGELEAMLAELEPDDLVFSAVVALLSSCSMLAINVIDTPTRKPLISVA